MLRSPLRPLLRKPMQGLIGPGPYTLVKKAIGILRSYGTDAHVYLPGVGTVNGITAGNYLNSAGTTAATVDNPVGLSLDALQAMTLGSELLSGNWQNGYTTSFDTFTSTSPTSFSGTNASTESVRVKAPASFVAGTTYQVTLAGSLTNATITSSWVSDSVYGGVQDIGLTSIGQQVIFKAASTADSLMIIFAASSGAAVNAQVSVREIPGIHASQATTANKPILRQSGGKYSWQFDGSNDSLLSGNLGITTACTIVIAGRLNSLATVQTLFAEDANGVQIYIDTSGIVTLVKFGVSLIVNTAAATIVAGVPFVVTVRLSGGTAVIRKNGVQVVTAATALAFSATTGARIGTNFDGTTQPAGGAIGWVVPLPAALSDADCLTVERLVAAQFPGLTTPDGDALALLLEDGSGFLTMETGDLLLLE